MAADVRYQIPVRQLLRSRYLIPIMLLLSAGGALAEESVPNAAAPASEPAAAPALDAPALPEPMRLTMEFQDANLKDVLKSFSQQSGINIIASAEVADQPVTLFLENVTVLDALDQILRVSNLTYDRQPGSDIYLVKPQPPGAVANTLTRVYRLKYARVSKSNLAKAAAAFGNSTPFEAEIGEEESGSSSSSAGGGGGSSQEVGIDLVLQGFLTSQGRLAVDPRTNSVLITDVPENFPRLEAALAALDVRTAQIMIDAEVIETTMAKVKDLGVEWGGSTGQVLAFTPGSRSTRFPFGLFGQDSQPTQASETSGNMTTGTLSFASFQAVLEALQTDTDTKILARPKILTLDNESALIKLTTNEAIGFTSSESDAGNTTSEPERTITGIVLVVTPQANEYGYITMLVQPTVSKTVASRITPPSGQATPRDPKTRSARAMVRVRSGDTLVLGGLIDRSDQTSMRKVPILSGIPFMGEAFKNEEIDHSTSELIVFLTPRVLDESTPAQLAATPSPLGPREQEAMGQRQDTIEQSLNQLERPQGP